MTTYFPCPPKPLWKFLYKDQAFFEEWPAPTRMFTREAYRRGHASQRNPNCPVRANIISPALFLSFRPIGRNLLFSFCASRFSKIKKYQFSTVATGRICPNLFLMHKYGITFHIPNFKILGQPFVFPFRSPLNRMNTLPLSNKPSPFLTRLLILLALFGATFFFSKGSMVRRNQQKSAQQFPYSW